VILVLVKNRRTWILVAAAVLLGGAALWFVQLQRSRGFAATPAGMLQRLPTHASLVLFVDFEALRRGCVLKLLAKSKVTEEPEYQAFVRSTGFDYGRDLDLTAVAFRNEGEFLLIKGRFDWNKLENYARDQGGSCYKHLCRMAGSTPERRISFFPVQTNLMALAVATDSFAVTRLEDAQAASVQPLETPTDPIWLSVPAESLRSAENLPAGTKIFAGALASANQILLSMGALGDRYEARLQVTCRTSQEAAVLSAQLEHTTTLLRYMIARENQRPNPKDLSGVLTAGVFQHADRRVFGRWPIPETFLESLAGGTQ